MPQCASNINNKFQYSQWDIIDRERDNNFVAQSRNKNRCLKSIECEEILLWGFDIIYSSKEKTAPSIKENHKTCHRRPKQNL